ncbi:hypothetical protein BABINDRAFT_11843 [Babjeviella inositovora NRRL Y-12698]|uniref:4a-hydroxytetrahydrobiopterin dehydratase n=1 Tax=Babjeviella inositovora NRRL Y-12698 TaxID=984486 RepID=A0A1E3QVR1_9ASCO|nr:uncharacterized protein BABINDRAFT_11843 [Babjeviella inositovora NRRL Y-12698]ODQ81749.1 hypothetical protein BABINDRAFT_11843 [Babjeviella inositovora NRRL Y-12698]
MYNKIAKISPVKTVLKLNAVLPNWKVAENGASSSLSRSIVCKNFEDTWALLTKVSMRAHLLGHHPTITTTYNKISFRLTTHDLAEAGGEGVISDVDVKLAKKIDEYAGLFLREDRA